MAVKPSFQNGFARSAGESAYPDLWKGLVGAWIPAIGPTGGKLYDLSPYGNHGTLTNMDPATDWVVGQKGYALDFDGSNDYVAIADPANGSLDVGTGDFTLSIWIRPNVNNARFLSKGGFANLTAGYVLNLKVGNTVELECSNGTTRPISASGGSVTVDGIAWTHVVAVVDRNVGYKVYLNGSVSFSGSVDTSSDNFNSSQNLNIGRRSDGSDYHTGCIGATYIFKRALSANEVAQLYINPLAPFELRRQIWKAPAATGPVIVQSMRGR